MLYFSDERTKFKCGNLQLQTECPFYEPGNSITGKVFLQIHEPTEATNIKLEAKGSEKSSFIRFYVEDESLKSEKCKDSKTFLHEKKDVFPIVDGILQPGLYQIDF